MPRIIPRSGRRARAPASPARRRSCSWWCSWRATWTWWPTSSPCTTPPWRSSLSAPRPPLSTSCMSSSRPRTTATTIRSGALLLVTLLTFLERSRPDTNPIVRCDVVQDLKQNLKCKFLHYGTILYTILYWYILRTLTRSVRHCTVLLRK